MVAIPNANNGMFSAEDFMFPGLGSTGPYAPSISTPAGGIGSYGAAPSTGSVFDSIAALSALKGPGGAAGVLGGAKPGVGGVGAPGGLGANLGTAQLGLAGLQTIAGIWSAFKAASLAKKQFNYTKDVTDTNLANQIRSYNTSLEDRARSRGVVEGQTAQQVQDYIARNAATRG